MAVNNLENIVKVKQIKQYRLFKFMQNNEIKFVCKVKKGDKFEYKCIVEDITSASDQDNRFLVTEYNGSQIGYSTDGSSFDTTSFELSIPKSISLSAIETEGYYGYIIIESQENVELDNLKCDYLNIEKEIEYEYNSDTGKHIYKIKIKPEEIDNMDGQVIHLSIYLDVFREQSNIKIMTHKVNVSLYYNSTTPGGD